MDDQNISEIDDKIEKLRRRASSDNVLIAETLRMMMAKIKHQDEVIDSLGEYVNRLTENVNKLVEELKRKI